MGAMGNGGGKVSFVMMIWSLYVLEISEKILGNFCWFLCIFTRNRV